MLYFLYGDSLDARKSLVKHLDSLSKKRPDAEVFRVKKDNFTEDLIKELTASFGLFERKYIVVLDSLLEESKSSSYILSFLEEFKKSEHIFLLIEDDPSKKEIEEVSKYSEKVWFFPKKDKKDFNNIFSLANFLAKKDKKNLWIEYLKFIDSGVSAEEIGGVLFWQMKNIALTKKTKNVSESKLSPFADKNARTFAVKWNENDVLDIMDRIVDINQKVRDGEGESDILLEHLILNI
jgi:DNA polymerase III delta subunit